MDVIISKERARKSNGRRLPSTTPRRRDTRSALRSSNKNENSGCNIVIRNENLDVDWRANGQLISMRALGPRVYSLRPMHFYVRTNVLEIDIMFSFHSPYERRQLTPDCVTHDDFSCCSLFALVPAKRWTPGQQIRILLQFKYIFRRLQMHFTHFAFEFTEKSFTARSSYCNWPDCENRQHGCSTTSTNSTTSTTFTKREKFREIIAFGCSSLPSRLNDE